MRTIETQETRDKRLKRNQILLSAFLILILVGSTAGYAISILKSNNEPTTTTNSNGPTYNGQFWVINKNGAEFLLTSSPDEVKDVPVNVNLTLAQYAGQSVFVTADNDVTKQEIGGVLGRYVGHFQEACYGPCNNTQLPEKDCSSFLIVWNASETNRVYQQDQCVFIQGTITATDAFLYKLLGY